MYPYPYFPVYDQRAEVKVLVTPKTAAVYVDGFYAGIVDDFNGAFQSLPLPPGGHTIVLYLDGYRTARQSFYLRPGSTLKLREALARLAPGETSEPPVVAPPVPPPPQGSTTAPLTPSGTVATAPAPTEHVDSFGTLELTVKPRGATVTIDGVRWVSSDDGLESRRCAAHAPTVCRRRRARYRAARSPDRRRRGPLLQLPRERPVHKEDVTHARRFDLRILWKSSAASRLRSLRSPLARP